MSSAKNGDTVKVHYTGKLDDGTVFDSSVDRDPLTFTIGQGRVIPGFENFVIGMAVGDNKTDKIVAASAYGDRKDELLFEIERDKIPEDIHPEVGLALEMRQPDGNSFSVTIANVSEKTVTLDANHPLAGEDLTFEITLLEIG